MKSLSV